MSNEPLGRITDAMHEDQHGLLDDVRNATVRVQPNRVEIVLYQDDPVWVERALHALRDGIAEVVIAYRDGTP